MDFHQPNHSPVKVRPLDQILVSLEEVQVEVEVMHLDETLEEHPYAYSLD
jgi:hypothetical protein